jgi:histidinol-phosphate aminotransferase
VTTRPPEPSRRSLFGEIRPYVPDPRRCAIDLSDNTNLWGSPPAATRAATENDSMSLARYPEVHSETLKDAIARTPAYRRNASSPDAAPMTFST